MRMIDAGETVEATRVEYHTKTIARSGDAFGCRVFGGPGSKSAAVKWMRQRESMLPYREGDEMVVACVIERVEYTIEATTRIIGDPSSVDIDEDGDIEAIDEQTVAWCGDEAALRRGGWLS
ncbi:MAG: hypothetical protein D6746_11405 [Bacteroidetes bacterium]|nr:MAG: hypothetical protein D6746_11405 [Bacteroidota bacterium]